MAIRSKWKRLCLIAMALLLYSSFALPPSFAEKSADDGWIDGNGSLIIKRQKTQPGGRPTEPGSQPPSGGDQGGGSVDEIPEDPYEYFAHYGCPRPGEDVPGDACNLNPSCARPDGGRGVLHRVFRRLRAGGEWESTGTQYCAAPGSQSPEDAAQRVTAPPTPTVTAEDLKKMPIQPGTVSIQPGPNTLKNYHTNIYADSRPQELDVTLLGQPVQVRATPVSYTFDYGDGTTTGPTTDPGRALPENSWDTPTSTSHQYRETGDYAIVISTEFRGEYRVGDGEWQQVEGTATLPSQPQTVSVWRTKSGWVKDGCSANPRAWGC